ncbi:MAG: hypothetical protein WC694_03300 [Candidatus Paceibacterota bacterium]|jgi:predicted lipoprotein with Yx(FWY)xxD motif
MKTSNIVVIVLIVIIVIGGLYFFSMKPTTRTEVNPSNTEQKNTTPILKVSSNPTLGSFLVASNGMTLYLFTKDTVANVSTCYDTCAVNWPPYTVSADQNLSADEGINGVLATTTRTDGSKQLTYNGIPLYFWKFDKVVGDTTGQNVGGVWFVLKP